LGAARLPSLEIFTKRDAAATGPTIERAQPLDAAWILLVFRKNGQGHRLRELIETRDFDLASMLGKPTRCVASKPLHVSECGIAFDDVGPIFGNGIAECIVAGERRVLFPVLSNGFQN
jgi:hypothetical protein